MEKAVSGIILTLLLVGIMTLAFNVQPISAQPRTWTVDDDGPADFHTIQEAMTAANSGDIISVYNGTYHKTVQVEKAVSLKGENKEATIIDGGLSLYASHVNITGFTLQGGGEYGPGIYLYTGSNWNTISDIVINGNNGPYGCGVALLYSNNNTIQDNVIRNSTQGFNLEECYGNTISNNNITNSWVGISQQHSSENIICCNNIAGAPANTGAGIQIDWDGRNIISNNSIIGNDYGILLQGSNENYVSGNNIVNNDEGIHVYESNGNLLYHNNFIANTHQVYDASSDYPSVSPSINTWDDGYPSGGNYWSDYAGVDIKNGPNQDQPGSDGIGDTPFLIDANNHDNYPLKSIWGKVNDVELPVADAGPDQTINSGTTVTFNGSRSTDDFAIKSHVWTFTDVNQQTLTGIYPHYTFNNPGQFEVTLNVSDYADNWDTDAVTITVLAELELVVSIAAPKYLHPGASTTLTAIITNPGPNDAANAELVLLINGTAVKSATVSLLQMGDSYALDFEWIPTIAGTYNVTAFIPPLLGEVDTQNNKATAFVTVSAPQPPVASFTYSPTTPIAGKTVTFDASGSYDPDGSITSYDWEFGDGTTCSGRTVAHAYANSGSYTVTLTATDNEDTTDTETSTITILMAPKIGVKAGDWIKVEYTISGAPSGTPLPQWLKVEFLDVEGTNATVRVTMHMTDGTEPSQTMTIDVAVGSGTFQGLSGFIIPANCTTGDSVYVSGYGNLAVAGETARNYAGTSRTVVYASISQLGSQLTYYWDKQTGIMVEATTVSGTMTASGKATETNIWQTQSTSLPIDPIVFYALVIAAIAIVAGVAFFAIRRKKKPPKEATLSQS